VKRKIPLLSVKDRHVVEIVDGGVDREGYPTGQRQALERILSKTVEVDGKRLPIFRLAGEPTPWTFARDERMPGADEMEAWDERWIYESRDGERVIKGAYPAWSKARDRFLANSDEMRRQAEAQVEAAILGDVGKGLSQLVKAAAGNMPAKVAK